MRARGARRRVGSGAFGAGQILCRSRPALAEVASGAPVLVGTGDIASCDERGDEKTARLLDGIFGTVFTVGDNAYKSGRAREYRRCYKPSWGRHKARMRPAPGNHDYRSSGAAPYYDYFGQKAGPAGRGYYSYDLGAWHVISLNSNVAAEEGSPQSEWLREEHAANPSEFTVAYWNHAVFSSGEHGNSSRMAQIWKLLDESGVDVHSSGTITTTSGSRHRTTPVRRIRAASASSSSAPAAGTSDHSPTFNRTARFATAKPSVSSS